MDNFFCYVINVEHPAKFAINVNTLSRSSLAKVKEGEGSREELLIYRQLEIYLQLIFPLPSIVQQYRHKKRGICLNGLEFSLFSFYTDYKILEFVFGFSKFTVQSTNGFKIEILALWVHNSNVSWSYLT